MSDELVDSILGAARDISVAPNSSDDFNPSIPVGKTYRPGIGLVEQNITYEQMQSNIKAWAGTFNPNYAKYAQNMVDAGFMPETYVDQPLNAANALRNSVEVYLGYKATGGDLGYNEWFDWYAGNMRQIRAARRQGSGGGGGPTMSITRMNESDIDTSADAIARQTIGRGLRAAETEEAIDAMRQAETANPQVSTVSGRTRVTDQGLTEDERRKVLQRVVKDNPEFLPFQFDTTVLDAIGEQIEKARTMFDG